VQLEQAAYERPCVITRKVAALDERNGMREIRERQAPGQTRSVRALGRVGGCDQLTGGAAAQPSAPAELSCLRHERSVENCGR
jgi:hypothetical protein